MPELWRLFQLLDAGRGSAIAAFYTCRPWWFQRNLLDFVACYVPNAIVTYIAYLIRHDPVINDHLPQPATLASSPQWPFNAGLTVLLFNVISHQQHTCFHLGSFYSTQNSNIEHRFPDFNYIDFNYTTNQSYDQNSSTLLLLFHCTISNRMFEFHCPIRVSF